MGKDDHVELEREGFSKNDSVGLGADDNIEDSRAEGEFRRWAGLGYSARNGPGRLAREKTQPSWG